MDYGWSPFKIVWQPSMQDGAVTKNVYFFQLLIIAFKSQYELKFKL